MYDENGVRYLDCINNVCHGKRFMYCCITTIIFIILIVKPGPYFKKEGLGDILVR